jgi:hypothetical protein
VLLAKKSLALLKMSEANGWVIALQGEGFLQAQDAPGEQVERKVNAEDAMQL